MSSSGCGRGRAGGEAAGGVAVAEGGVVAGSHAVELWTGVAVLQVCSWNLNRAFAVGAEQGARSLQQMVEALLDWMAAAGVSVQGLQETGWEGVAAPGPARDETYRQAGAHYPTASAVTR